ncbi:uncharacterized protein MYCFIDRAFT_85363 [Pseudocercospora fijiensis CIRAD86]|uniref:Uncharacterized protein n=1 Tax=Pseudocercospora fijiensis (strain CIRAD86) TaxID=383855 RepID=M2ZXW7_PSEFD|nr:uncharacterized protein MYCFIDRAFT_85363 [Pseudocercospora fijiensis CIRAD86]EME76961.1 hypothetical protein MYCFIDRAFT_85363 [Pseudocercospora fijiensis CIRAD86]
MSEASSTGKEAVKVPGSDHTFLNPENSRPHNGVVAYPFKLKNIGKAAANKRSPSPNASTMTLESVDGSDRASTRSTESSRLKAARILGVSPMELPSDLPGTSGAGGTNGAKRDPGSTASPDEHRSGSETDMIPTLEVSPAAFHETGNVQDGNSSSASSRPVSMLPENVRVSHLKSPEENPVGPLSPSEQQDPIATTTAKHRQGRVEYRDSRLGQLGADGMPTQAFPETSSASRPAPFKIRNPVYDNRASADVTGQTVDEQSQPLDASKPAPFKMRHVVYDARVAPVGSKPPGSDAEAAASVAANGSSKSETSLSSDAQALPGTAVTSPAATAAAVVAAQHAAARSVSTNSTASPIDDEKEVVHFSHNNANRDFPQTNNTTQPTGNILSRPAPPVRPSSSGPPPTPPPKDPPKLEKEAHPILPAKSLAQGRSRDNLKGSDGSISGPDDNTISSTKRKPVAVPTSKFSRSNENLSSYGNAPSLPAGAAAALAGVRARSASAETSGSSEGTSYDNQAVSAASVACNNSGMRPEFGVLPLSKFSPAASSSPKEKLQIDPPAAAPAPTIGNLSFERSPVKGDFGDATTMAENTNTTSTPRPPLETFITAQEALDLGMKEGQKF